VWTTTSFRTSVRVLASGSSAIGFEATQPPAVRSKSSDPCCVQHLTSGALLPQRNTQMTHVVTYVACNIQQQEPPILLLDTIPNITCLQRRNSTSTTMKFNVCNVQHQRPSSLLLDTTPNIACLRHRKLCLQHQKYLYIILKHSYGTLATSAWSSPPASCATALKLLQLPSSCRDGPPSFRVAGVLPLQSVGSSELEASCLLP
jgi:hypothetical protein